MLLEHWKHSHHDIILGHKTSHSTFVPLNSRNQMRMNTTNLDSEHEVSSLKNYEDRTEKKKGNKGGEESHPTTAIHKSSDFLISGCKA